MEPPENGDSRDAALGLARTRNRLLLRESLVRTRLVVEAHELGDQASQVVLAVEFEGLALRALELDEVQSLGN